MGHYSRAEIEEIIKRLLISELEVSPALLAGSTTETSLLGRGVGLDSVEAMGLALSLEREFDILIPDSDLTEELFVSIGALAHYVGRKAAEQLGA